MESVKEEPEKPEEAIKVDNEVTMDKATIVPVEKEKKKMEVEDATTDVVQDDLKKRDVKTTF